MKVRNGRRSGAKQTMVRNGWARHGSYGSVGHNKAGTFLDGQAWRGGADKGVLMRSLAWRGTAALARQARGANWYGQAWNGMAGVARRGVLAPDMAKHGRSGKAVLSQPRHRTAWQARCGTVKTSDSGSGRRTVARSGSVSRAMAGSVWLRAARRSAVGSVAVVNGSQGKTWWVRDWSALVWNGRRTTVLHSVPSSVLCPAGTARQSNPRRSRAERRRQGIAGKARRGVPRSGFPG